MEAYSSSKPYFKHFTLTPMQIEGCAKPRGATLPTVSLSIHEGESR